MTSDNDISATDNQIKEETPTKKSTFAFGKPFAGRQKKCIIFTIVATLILTMIVMLATMIPLLSSTNTKDKTSMVMNSINGNDHTVSTAVVAIIYDVGGGGTSGNPPCSSHTVINDPSRNVGGFGTGGICDNGPLFNTSIGGNWIRFIGTGGVTIPMTTPGVSHCGAFITGWFNGTLPSIVQTIANGTVCFESYVDPCFALVPVKVVNCATFYVYFLPPMLICNARYCTT